MKNKGFLVHGGQAFESMGSGKFAKDILQVGAYIHPTTKQIIEITPERIDKLARNTMQYLENKNEVFFPDGHTTEAAKNLGDWPGPFFKHGDRLMGVVEPKADRALEGINAKTMNRVSAMIDFNVTDPKGKLYDEVITHVCATPMPVITGQKDFVKLSQIQDNAGGPPLYFLSADCPVQTSATGIRDELAVAAAFDKLSSVEGSKEDRVAAAFLELSEHRFEDCVQSVMRERGLSRERAQAVCAAVKRRSGEINRT